MRRRGFWRRRWLVLTSVVVLVAGIVLSARMRPLIRELAKARVENRGQNVVNEAIELQMESGQIDYANIVILEKDRNGTVTALKTIRTPMGCMVKKVNI